MERICQDILTCTATVAVFQPRYCRPGRCRSALHCPFRFPALCRHKKCHNLFYPVSDLSSTVPLFVGIPVCSRSITNARDILCVVRWARVHYPLCLIVVSYSRFRYNRLYVMSSNLLRTTPQTTVRHVLRMDGLQVWLCGFRWVRGGSFTDLGSICAKDTRSQLFSTVHPALQVASSFP